MQEIKAHLVKVYFSTEEKTFIENRAQLNGLSTASYIKNTCLNHSINSSNLDFFALYNYGNQLKQCLIDLHKIASKSSDISVVQQIETTINILKSTMLVVENLSFLRKNDAEVMLSNQIELSTTKQSKVDIPQYALK